MSKLRSLKKLGVSSFLFLWIIFCIFPIFWTLLTSLKSPSEAATLPPSIFFNPSFANYKTVLFADLSGFYGTAQNGFGINFRNSLIVATSSTIFSLILGTMSSYYISRFSKNNNISFWILSIKMMPPIAAIVPYFLMVNFVGLVDSVVSLILIYTVFNLPMTVWLTFSFFNKIPKVYDDMASVDGLTNYQFFTKVLIPLSKPALITSALLSFIFSWNEFLFALILSGVKSKTLPVLATGFITQRGILWGQLTATSIIIILPILIIIILMQSKFVKGMSMGLGI